MTEIPVKREDLEEMAEVLSRNCVCDSCSMMCFTATKISQCAVCKITLIRRKMAEYLKKEDETNVEPGAIS